MKKVFILSIVMLFAINLLHAQDRYNNVQWSVAAGSMIMPQASFLDLNGGTIDVQDPGQMLPLTLSVQFEREYMVASRLGFGWTLGAGLRNGGWKATVPAATPNLGTTPSEDWALSIPMVGGAANGGIYASFHLASWFEIYASAGAAAVRYWNVSGSAASSSTTDNEATDSADEGIEATLLGAYGQLGFKVLFQSDCFVSLSARYSYSLTEGAADGLFNWSDAAYSTRVTAPFASDLSVMLGVGVMLED